MEREEVKTKMEEHIRSALEYLSMIYPYYDLTNPHNINTPKRIAKMWIESFKGLNPPDFEFTIFPNEDEQDGWIIEKNIEFSSFCAHHLMPFFGVAHIGYIPDKVICGLSKIPRVVEYYSSKPQVQETLGEEILYYLYMNLKPKKLVVIIEAKHTCVGCRGIKSRNVETITTHSLNKKDLLEFKELLK